MRILKALAGRAPIFWTLLDAFEQVILPRNVARPRLGRLSRKYGDTGVMTFITDQNGVVYEKDLGKNTTEVARAMREFNPDSGWSPVQK